MRTTSSISLIVTTLACGGGSAPLSEDTSTGAGETGETVDLSCPEGTSLGIESSTGCIIGDPEGDLDQWLGIPYAKPPVGDLRFARTVPAEPWTEPLEADDFGDYCIQQIEGRYQGEEDCLSLNIFRPEDIETDAGLPILFFTHGGSFTSGAGSEDTYALEPELAERAVLVTHNYRLGFMGFFPHEDLSEEDDATHGDGGSSGNQAFFDSLTALQWVHENAEAMGGDPERIVIFGESAGGGTTCALLTSPLAADLFSAAVVQSYGCGFLEWPLRDSSGNSGEDYGDTLAAELGCGGSDTLSCLRELEADELMEDLADFGVSPVIDEVLMNRPAREAFSEGDFNRVPVVAGFNGNEGVMFSGGMGIETDEDLAYWLEGYGDYFGFSDIEQLSEIYTAAAFGSPQQAFDVFYGDMFFACPTRYFLESVNEYVDTRAYFFSEAPDWLQYSPGYEDWGAFHAAELAFVFGTNQDYYSDSEQALSQQMQKAWVSLADTPEVEGLGDWPLFETGADVSEDGGSFVEFNAENTVLSTGVFKDRCDFLEAQGWQR